MILSSEGFTGAKDLASKIVSMFTLSKQLLSRQQHYDWGLRALKAVLNTGGKLIQVPGSVSCDTRERLPAAVRLEREKISSFHASLHFVSSTTDTQVAPPLMSSLQANAPLTAPIIRHAVYT